MWGTAYYSTYPAPNWSATDRPREITLKKQSEPQGLNHLLLEGVCQRHLRRAPEESKGGGGKDERRARASARVPLPFASGKSIGKASSPLSFQTGKEFRRKPLPGVRRARGSLVPVRSKKSGLWPFSWKSRLGTGKSENSSKVSGSVSRGIGRRHSKDPGGWKKSHRRWEKGRSGGNIALGRGGACKGWEGKERNVTPGGGGGWGEG